MRKAFGLILFLLLTTTLLAFVFLRTIRTEKKKILKVELSGNLLLSTERYLSDLKLNDILSKPDISIRELQVLALEHPYIEFADVTMSGENTARIEIKEKKILAAVFAGGSVFILTDTTALRKVPPETQLLDVPVISNCGIKDTSGFVYAKFPLLKKALSIIRAAEAINSDLLAHLSEVDMRNGKDILLRFSDLRPPVLFGKGEVVRKLMTLDELRKTNETYSLMVQESPFIDVRYTGAVFTRFVEKVEPKETDTKDKKKKQQKEKDNKKKEVSVITGQQYHGLEMNEKQKETQG